MDEPDFGTKTTEEERERRRIIPPVALPSTRVEPTEPWLPGEILKRHGLAVRNGWQADLFRAIGPRIDQHGYCVDPAYQTLGLRATRRAADGVEHRVVIVYGWRPDVAKPGWKFDGAWVIPGLVEVIEDSTSQMHMSKVNVTTAEAELRSE